MNYCTYHEESYGPLGCFACQAEWESESRAERRNEEILAHGYPRLEPEDPYLSDFEARLASPYICKGCMFPACDCECIPAVSYASGNKWTGLF